MYTKGFKPHVTVQEDSATVHMVLETIGGKKLVDGITVKSVRVKREPGEAIDKSKLDRIMDVQCPLVPSYICRSVIDSLYRYSWMLQCTVMEYYIFQGPNWKCGIFDDPNLRYNGYIVVLNSRTNEYQMYFIYPNDGMDPYKCGFELMDFGCLAEQLNTFCEEQKDDE